VLDDIRDDPIVVSRRSHGRENFRYEFAGFRSVKVPRRADDAARPHLLTVIERLLMPWAR